MRSFPLFGEDNKADSAMQKVIRNALGKVLILEEAATTSNGIVPEGEAGFFGTTIYFTISGTTYSIAMVAV